MRVKLKFHQSVQPALTRWAVTLGRTERQRRERFAIDIAVMKERLQECDGILPEAVPDQFAASVWWWQFSGTLSVQYRITESPPPPRGWWDLPRRIARLIRVPTRTIVVIGLDVRPPPG